MIIPDEEQNPQTKTRTLHKPTLRVEPRGLLGFFLLGVGEE